MWGKQRSKFGKWMDNQDEYNQREFGEVSGVSKDTITKACSDPDYVPSSIVIKKIMKIVKEINPHKRSSDFWDI